MTWPGRFPSSWWRSAVSVLLVLAALPSMSAHADDRGSVTGRVTASPLEAVLVLDPALARTGDRVAAVVEVRQSSSHTLHDVEVTVHAPDELRALPGRRRSRPSLEPDGSLQARWLLCGSAPGTYVVLARVSAVTAANVEVSTETSAHVLTLAPRAQPGPRCPRE